MAGHFVRTGMDTVRTDTHPPIGGVLSGVRSEGDRFPTVQIDPAILRRIAVLLAARIVVVLEPDGARSCDGVVVVTVALRRSEAPA
jgi:hypothetical protein